MKRVVAGAVVALALVNSNLTAQSCTGTNSCAVTVNASVTVPALVSLDVTGGPITLTPPAVGDLGGSVLDNGPSFTVKANRSWNLSVHAAASDWSYSGTESGAKALSDLTWSNTAGGTFVAMTTTAAAIVTAQAKTSAGNPTIFFRTHYAADFADPGNAVGTFSIPLVFTVAAP